MKTDSCVRLDRELRGCHYINETDRTLCVHDGSGWVVIARDVDVEAYRAIIGDVDADGGE